MTQVQPYFQHTEDNVTVGNKPLAVNVCSVALQMNATDFVSLLYSSIQDHLLKPVIIASTAAF